MIDPYSTELLGEAVGATRCVGNDGLGRTIRRRNLFASCPSFRIIVMHIVQISLCLAFDLWWLNPVEERYLCSVIVLPIFRKGNSDPNGKS